MDLSEQQRERLLLLGQALIDQQRARVIIPPTRGGCGYWFGGGNMIRTADGTFYLCGRYRSAGDSRSGTEAGVRGFELSVFKSADAGKGFEKILSFSKQDLSCGDRQVISIERAWLHSYQGRIELFVSSEKSGIPYADNLESYQKQGTGVWTVDRIEADTVEALDPARIEPLIASRDPRFLHVKDPFAFDNQRGDTVLILCTHPFNWSSSNSAYSIRPQGSTGFGQVNYEFFPRGYTWDVAISRLTSALRLPALGVLKDLPPVYLFFYDGGESVRHHQEHEQAVKRPRGYSCEELGGLAFSTEQHFPHLERLSVNLPLFISPYGTGCSRYVAALETDEGIYSLWEQSQKDLSQPLVMNFLNLAEVERILD